MRSEDIIASVAIFMVAFVVIVVLGAFVTQFAWNIVMPYVFKLPAITFLQALGINLLIGAVRTVVTVKK
jgi:hypothetical protein